MGESSASGGWEHREKSFPHTVTRILENFPDLDQSALRERLLQFSSSPHPMSVVKTCFTTAFGFLASLVPCVSIMPTFLSLVAPSIPQAILWREGLEAAGGRGPGGKPGAVAACARCGLCPSPRVLCLQPAAPPACPRSEGGCFCGLARAASSDIWPCPGGSCS